MALGLIYGLLTGLEHTPAIRPPLPPKYDAKLSKAKGQFVFMSEMTLSDLSWWLGKKNESALSGGQYAEKDKKTAETLTRWVAWRECFPTDQWFGERNDTKTTAAPPSREPRMHSWDSQPQRGSRQAAPAADDGYGEPPKANGFSDDDYGAKEGEDSLPF